jgi:hypothetical protein
MDLNIANSMGQRRFAMMFGLFAVMAVVLASIGIYGVDVVSGDAALASRSGSDGVKRRAGTCPGW